MAGHRVLSSFLVLAGLSTVAGAHPRGTVAPPGALVSVTVEVDGVPAPLYPAPDGSGRLYLEAFEGRPYAIGLANRGAERVAVALTVDGLDVISGRRDDGRGRMYVLDPWQSMTVRGWRTSLDEVRQFTFVDEGSSYAARSGKANRKMGWIELAVYRERHASVRPLTLQEGRHEREERPAAPAAAAPERQSRGRAGVDDAESRPLSSDAATGEVAEARRSYPGTGWGRETRDPAVLVSFDPEPSPFETVVVRYEYRDSLVALGVLPRRWPQDRLHERDHADSGFAQPPRW